MSERVLPRKILYAPNRSGGKWFTLLVNDEAIVTALVDEGQELVVREFISIVPERIRSNVENNALKLLINKARNIQAERVRVLSVPVNKSAFWDENHFKPDPQNKGGYVRVLHTLLGEVN